MTLLRGRVLLRDGRLEQAAARPVLQLKGFNEPVIIESIELLKRGKEHFLRVGYLEGRLPYPGFELRIAGRP